MPNETRVEPFTLSQRADINGEDPLLLLLEAAQRMVDSLDILVAAAALNMAPSSHDDGK